MSEESIITQLHPDKVDMNSYGQLIEEYDYTLSNGKIKEISYSQYDKDGEEVKSVGVSNDDGHYHRSVVIWPGIDNNNPDGYLQGTVLEMKLDLDTIDPDFSMDSLDVMVKPDDDKFEINVDFPSGGSFEKAVDPVTIIPGKGNKIAAYRNQHIYKEYAPDNDFPIEEMRAFSNCFVWKDNDADTLGVLYLTEVNGEETLEQIYGFYSPERIVEDNPIDVISQTCYGRVQVTKGDTVYDLIYYYDSDGTISGVEYKTPDMKDPQIISRVETYIPGYEKGNNKRSRYAAVYPVALTLNYENFDHYKPGELWAFDTASYNDEGDMEEFSRMVYAITDESMVADLVRYISSNADWPILS